MRDVIHAPLATECRGRSAAATNAISNPRTPLADKIDDAQAKIAIALVELNKTPPDNQAAVGNIEGAVGELEAVVTSRLLDPDNGMHLMDKLAGLAWQLAAEALDEAIAHGRGDPAVIADGNRSLSNGDALRTSGLAGSVGDFKAAVNKYKDALAKAESVIR